MRPTADTQLAQALTRTLSDPTIQEAFGVQESALVDEIAKCNPFDEKQLLSLCHQLRAIRLVRSAGKRHEQQQRLRAIND